MMQTEMLPQGCVLSLRIAKPWIPLTAENLARLPAELGVFEIADSDGQTLFIGYAGGRSLFGLRSELEAVRTRWPERSLSFRAEVTSQYLSRHEELLMVHKAEHGTLPRENVADSNRRIGRLSPG